MSLSVEARIFSFSFRSLNAATTKKKKKRSGVEAPLSETGVAAAETSRRHSQFLLSRAAEALFKSCSTCPKNSAYSFFFHALKEETIENFLSGSGAQSQHSVSHQHQRMSPTTDDLFAFYCYFLSFGIFVLVRVLSTSHSAPTQSLVPPTPEGKFSGRLDPLKVISRSGVSEVPVSSPSLLPREVSRRVFRPSSCRQ